MSACYPLQVPGTVVRELCNSDGKGNGIGQDGEVATRRIQIRRTGLKGQ
jgi:hypothetical protein